MSSASTRHCTAYNKPTCYGMRASTSLFLASLHFVRLKSETCMYVLNHQSGTIIVLVHVEDIAIASSSTDLLAWFKTSNAQRYSITDLGELHHFVGIAVTCDRAARTLTPTVGRTVGFGRLAEEQRTEARHAQAAVVVGEDLVHLDPE
jgi:hypothetical protein